MNTEDALADQAPWFSATMRLVSLVEGVGASMYMDVLHVFRARAWDAAMERSIQLGRSHEDGYETAEGKQLSWRLKEILTLDQIASDSIDGAEVHSQFVDVPPDEAVHESATFEPEASTPRQTV